MRKLNFNFKKIFVAMIFFIIIVVVSILSISSVKAINDLACIQVITPAKNFTTGECKDFPTPCDVPAGWNKVERCPVEQPPTISGVSGPTTLKVSEIGKWEVKASDPEQGILTYQVFWGDEAANASAQLLQPLIYYSQTATFTHSYLNSGVYYPTFTVTDNQGLSAKTSISVKVEEVATAPSIAVLSPNGGETWVKGTKQTIKWQDNTPDSTNSAYSLGLARLYNINLATYSPPCPAGMFCAQVVVPVIYKIAKSIPANYYSWTVGAIQELYDGLAPEGSYTVQVCQSGTNICDSSDSYFKIANQPKICAACVGGADTGKTDSSGCKIYLCPGQTCSAPVCKDGSDLYDTGKTDSSGCKIYSCQEANLISEKVKCVFKGSQTEQKCYAAVDNNGLSCSGKESCVMDVKRAKGEKITWKSSCGGYAYTTMDGTGGYDGRGEYAEFNCVTSSTTSEVTESKVEIIDMRYNAKDMIDNKYDSILSELKTLRDIIKEQQTQIKYLVSLKKDVKALSEKVESAINNFITYGVDENTKKLGERERAGVMNSYKSAFNKLPETEAELTDAIKIASGRFPSITNDKAEKKAKEQFIKIYKRIPDMDSAKDDAAIKVMAYGLRPAKRNLNSEKAGLSTFKSIYGHLPQSAVEWDAMRAITYSGTKRMPDADKDLLSDEMEKRLGTDPNKADTDGDGHKDGTEVNGGYDPLKK